MRADDFREYGTKMLFEDGEFVLRRGLMFLKHGEGRAIFRYQRQDQASDARMIILEPEDHVTKRLLSFIAVKKWRSERG